MFFAPVSRSVLKALLAAMCCVALVSAGCSGEDDTSATQAPASQDESTPAPTITSSVDPDRAWTVADCQEWYETNLDEIEYLEDEFFEYEKLLVSYGQTVDDEELEALSEQMEDVGYSQEEIVRVVERYRVAGIRLNREFDVGRVDDIFEDEEIFGIAGAYAEFLRAYAEYVRMRSAAGEVSGFGSFPGGEQWTAEMEQAAFDVETVCGIDGGG